MELSYADVYYSPEFQEWSLILGEEEAYYYARDEILDRLLLEEAQAKAQRRAAYHRYLETPAWREKAERVKAGAGQRCQLCYAAGELHTHHRTYERVGAELDTDLLALCARCHGFFHQFLGLAFT
ncbi:MAG: hypothetical protein ACRDNE_00250 [Gaiellaceae bacterium]